MNSTQEFYYKKDTKKNEQLKGEGKGKGKIAL